MGSNSGGRRRRAFSSLTGNPALLRVLAAYLLFILTEYAVWIAMLVFAYKRGGTTTAGLVAVAQLAPAAVVAPDPGLAADSVGQAAWRSSLAGDCRAACSPAPATRAETPQIS